MKVKYKSNTLLTLVSKNSIFTLSLWVGVFMAFAIYFNISDNLTPTEILLKPSTFMPLLVFGLILAFSTKTTVNIDKTTNNIYIEKKSLVKKDLNQIPMTNVKLIDEVERLYQSSKQTQYYYEIYLVLKDGTSILLGPTDGKRTTSSLGTKPNDPVVLELANFLGVPCKVSNLAHSDILNAISLTNVQIPSLIELFTGKKNGVFHHTNTEVMYNGPSTPQEQEQLRKIAEQIAMNNSQNTNPLVTKPQKDETFNNFAQNQKPQPQDPFKPF
jgi:hypothetical protein